MQPKLLPVLVKTKETYKLWHEYHTTLPKTHRYTLGQKIDTFFLDAVEAITSAGFLSKDKKQPYVIHAIRKMDTLKILLMILWETKSLDNKKYIALSKKLNEVGKMLGGWNGKLRKENSPQ